MDFSETLQDIEDKNETSLEEFRSSSHENGMFAISIVEASVISWW